MQERWQAVPVIIAAVIAVVFASPSCGGHASRDAPRVSAGATNAFLQRYVSADGRVGRRDQGNDTVSEGQAYALLLSAAGGESERFRTIWSWTRDHLQRDDALFAWHWADGHVVDAQPASDADVLIATALAHAAERFRSPQYARDAVRIAHGVVTNEIARTSIGPVLVAGPWARAERLVNPSYFLPFAFRTLGALTHDRVWDAMTVSATRIVAQLATHSLPPDWATVSASGMPTPHTGPDGSSPRFGFDAVRIPIIWNVNPPESSLVGMVANWNRLLLTRSQNERCALPLQLDATALPNAAPSAIACVAAAVGATAARDTPLRNALVGRARSLSSPLGSYYADAWIALAQALPTMTHSTTK
jgi:endo-1,4-beta-D-glucanase Y